MEQSTESGSVLTSSFVLQNIPVVIKLVLQNLSAKSLNTCSRVCKAWNTIAKSIKMTRSDMACFCVKYNEEEDVDRLAADIKSTVEDLTTEPNVLFMFCTTLLLEQQIKVPSQSFPSMRHPRAAKCPVMSVGSLVKKILPGKCQFLAVSSDGIVGTRKNVKEILEVESELALSCLFLPQINGLEFFTFSVDIQLYASCIDEPNSGLLYLNKRTSVPEGKDVKAILFFCDEPFCPPEIGYTLLQMYEGAVVAGGYVDNLIPSTTNPEDHSCDSGSTSLMCIALCGPSVRVASVVIKEDIRQPEEVEKILKKLKDCNLPEEKSFAFMFACIGRGSGHYGKENVESSVFRKLFPKTPLLGFFGNGEIGFNFLRKFQNDETKTNNTDSSSSQSQSQGRVQSNNIMPEGMAKPLPKLYHAYTTVVCMVSVV